MKYHDSWIVIHVCIHLVTNQKAIELSLWLENEKAMGLVSTHGFLC